MIAYELLMRQTPKESRINEMVNVLFVSLGSDYA